MLVKAKDWILYVVIIGSMFAFQYFDVRIAPLDAIYTWMISALTLCLLRYFVFGYIYNSRKIAEMAPDLLRSVRGKWYLIGGANRQIADLDSIYGLKLISLWGMLFGLLCNIGFLGCLFVSFHAELLQGFVSMNAQYFFFGAVFFVIVFLISILLKGKIVR